MHRQSLNAASLAIIAIIAVFVVLHQGKDLFAPVIAALLLGIVLTPVMDFWERLRLPPAIAALVSVVLALLGILTLMVLMEPYVTETINKAPVIWNELRGTIDELKRMLRGLERISEDVSAAIEPAGGEQAGAAVTVPSITDALFFAPQFAAQIMIFTGTLFFFLMTQNSIYAWVGATFKRFGETELRHAGNQVARYVLTITAINLVFGLLVAIVMHFLGMPQPVLWGVIAFALNFILYLGPITVAAALLVTGIVVFDGPASFVPAAVFLGMNATEGQFVTPTLIGKSLSVTPLMVFLSLVFWLWLWGPIGGVIAIPLLIWGLAVFQGLTRQTSSSGTPGTLYPRSAAAAAE